MLNETVNEKQIKLNLLMDLTYSVIQYFGYDGLKQIANEVNTSARTNVT